MDGGAVSEEKPTAEMVREAVDEVVALKQRIDAEWKDGKRGGLRLAVYGLADATERLFRALEREDPAAYKLAAQDARHSAMSAFFHGGKWVREGEQR